MTTYLLDELDQGGIVLTLTPPEHRALRAVEDRLGVEWLSDGRARIFSGGNVGSVAISDATVIQVQTKVPIGNLLTLASLAYQSTPLPVAMGETVLDTAEPVVDWLALLLVAELEALIGKGWRRDYVLVEQEIPYIRGRIRFDAPPRLARPGLTLCEFADFSLDTPENRLLRATLELLSTRMLLPGLGSKVVALLRYFGAVTFVRPTASLLAACRITRVNQHYRAALQLCRLFVEQSGIEADVGATETPAYFFPMATVFEKAITNLLATRVAAVQSQSGGTYKPIAGSPDLSLNYLADIVIGTPPRLVIDTKYATGTVRNPFGGWSLRNQHIYQAAFYALSLGCPAVLLYPRAGYDIDVTFQIGGVQVSVLTVDLREPGLESLGAFVELVGNLVQTWQ